MDRLYVANADIYLAFRAQFAGKFVVVCLMFGTAIPMLYLVAAFYFWLAAWIDRHNLLRNMAPPPRTPPTVARTLTLVVFPFALMLHCTMALFFFAQLPLAHGGDDPAHPGVGPDHGSGEALYPPPPSSPPPAPPSTDHEWLAYRIQIFVTVVVASCLGVFFIREIARRYGISFDLLSRRQKRVLLKVITQDPDEDQAALAVSGVLQSHRQDEYLPPLSASLLSLLGLEGARRTAHAAAKDFRARVSGRSEWFNRNAGVSPRPRAIPPLAPPAPLARSSSAGVSSAGMSSAGRRAAVYPLVREHLVGDRTSNSFSVDTSTGPLDAASLRMPRPLSAADVSAGVDARVATRLAAAERSEYERSDYDDESLPSALSTPYDESVRYGARGSDRRDEIESSPDDSHHFTAYETPPAVEEPDPLDEPLEPSPRRPLGPSPTIARAGGGSLD